MVTEAQEKLDVVEVTDEIVRQDRYGVRNYRNSIGADYRRHWRDDFLSEEEDVEGDSTTVDADTFEKAQQAADAEPTPEAEVHTEELAPTVEEPVEDEAEQTVSADASASSFESEVANIAGSTPDSEPSAVDQEDASGFFDPLKNVEGLDIVVSDVDTTDEEPAESAETVTDIEDQPDVEEERTDTVPEEDN